MDEDSQEVTSHIILDTNVLLDHLDTLMRFSEDVIKNRTHVKILIPGIVIRELDGMKATDKLGWPSRRATRWIMTSMKDNSQVVQCQSRQQTCKDTGDWHKPSLNALEEVNDDLILDYSVFVSQNCGRAFLATLDANLSIKAQSEGIQVLRPPSRWSSRSLAAQIQNLPRQNQSSDSFTAEELIYSTVDDVMNVDELNALKNPPAPPDDDAMDVDGDWSRDHGPPLTQIARMTPSEALKLLHLQVIDQYVGLIDDLVDRWAGNLFNENYAASTSSWAPSWSKTHPSKWKLGDRLEFLSSKRPGSIQNGQAGKIISFLAKPYVKHSGGRSGNDWPRATWEEVLRALSHLGKAFDDSAFTDSMQALDEPFHEIFHRKLSE